MTSPRFIDAIRFATLAHAGQLRKAPKGKIVPYIVHPMEAAQILATVGVTDEDVLIAAVLHDVLEDTKTTENDVLQRFGQKVLGIVKEVTDDPMLNRDEKKARQVTQGSAKSYAARLVKTADKCSNMKDLVRTPPGWKTKKIRGYAQHARDVVLAMNEDSDLPPHLSSLFWEASQNVIDWCVERDRESLEGKETPVASAV